MHGAVDRRAAIGESNGMTDATVPADEGAARGLAQAIGGAAVELSDAYAGLAGDESVKQLVVVIGTDRTDAGAATTAP